MTTERTMSLISFPSAAFAALFFFLAATDAANAYDAIGLCSAGTTTQKVTFVHVGDLHASFDLVDDKYSRIRAYLNQIRQENPNTVFTNAGDDHEKGSVAEQYSLGDATLEVTVAMQFDVRTIGNHDFAWGADHLLAFSRDPHSMVLTSNTTYDGSDPQGLGSVGYGVLQVGCLKIGFFGMVGRSWNELDEQVADDYLPFFHTAFDNANYISVAQHIVEANRAEVDLMVMVSHLGNDVDKIIAENVPGIDLVLGGHSHRFPAPAPEKVNTAWIVLPDFYGNGVTRVDLDVDLTTTPTSSVTSFSSLVQPVAGLTAVDPTVHQAIADIMTRYAPDAQKPIAYLEHASDNPQAMAEIAAKAAIQVHGADAALLDPEGADPWGLWPAGDVTTQGLIDSYYVERQPSDTPGINALYMVEVSGEHLQLMTAQTPTWVYAGPATPIAGNIYKVILHKAAAVHPATFFAGVDYLSVAYLSETWEALTLYGIYRTAECRSLDTDLPPPIPPCRTSDSHSIWTFSNTSDRLQADTGPGTLGYWNNTGTVTSFGTTGTFSLPQLDDGPDSGVMKFPAANSNQGIVLTHNMPSNGDYASSGLLSNYTLVMDLLWPLSSQDKWRGLLQTSPTNTDDADWFVRDTNAIGIWGSYFDTLSAGQWYRVALVARAAAAGGTLQFFINGQFVGELVGADQRWALGPTALLFADENNETAEGYAAGIFFAGYAMTKGEIAGLGNASTSFTQPAVNGVCGGANNGSFTTTPTSGLCSAGTIGTISGNGPWTWNCTGWNGGAIVSCAANLQTWTVTPTAGTGGSISPDMPIIVSHKGTATFVVSSNNGYSIGSVTGCNGSLNGGIYTTGAVIQACAVNALFIPVPINGTCGAPNGQILTAAPTSGLCSTGTPSAVTGSGPWTWSCAGANGGVTNSCSADIKMWTVTPIAGAGGNISPSTSQTVAQGGSLSFAVTPNAGYEIGTVSGCGGRLNGGIFTAGSITADCTVTATFSVTAPSVLTGDIDGDDDIDVADALKALRIAAGLDPETQASLSRGDVAPLKNGVPAPDGKIDIGDVIVILRRAVGLVSW